MTNLQQELSRVIQVAFDNEEAFLKEFPFDDYVRMHSIYSFHMASSECLVIAESWSMRQHRYTIKTTDYLSWVAQIEGEKE